MKIYKSAFIAIIVALAMGTSNAQVNWPSPGANHYEVLNFSLVVSQQGIVNSEPASGVVVSNVKKLKMTNKELLSFFATALNTNWPSGAQLAMNCDFRDEIYVVDKTRTNAVYCLSTGINVGGTNVTFFGVGFDGFIFSDNQMSRGAHLTDSQIHYSKVFFHLFSEENGVANTDLYFDGLDTFDSEAVEVNSHASVVQSDAASVTGDGTLSGTWGLVAGQVTGSIRF